MPVANTQTQPHSEADAQSFSYPQAKAHGDPDAKFDINVTNPEPDTRTHYRRRGDTIYTFRYKSSAYDDGLVHAEAHGFTDRDAKSFALGYAHATSHWGE